MLTDEEILAKLLALNQMRSGANGSISVGASPDGSSGEAKNHE
jgi:hypothetical protein